MAGEQWRSINPNFSGANQAMANAQRGFAGFTQGIGDIQNRLMAEEAQKAKLAQQAIENERASSLLGIQQAQEGRAAEDYATKVAREKAMADAVSIQKNITSGAEGQQRFEDYVNKLAAVPEYDKALADIVPVGSTPEEKAQSYNTQVQALRDKMQPVVAPAVDAKLEGLSRKYTTVSDLSGNEGLKYNIADESYKQRVYDQLVASGVDPKKAMEQSIFQESLVREPGTSKTMQEQIKAQRKDLDTREKAELEIIKNKFAQSKSGTGTKGEGGYKSTTKDAIADIGFGKGGFGSLGDSAPEVRRVLADINTELKTSKLKPTDAQMASALYRAHEGAADAWFSLDPTAAKEAVKKSLLEVMKADELSGGIDRSSGSMYSKYGPGYENEAAAVLNKYAAARKSLNSSIKDVGNFKGTGLAELEKEYGTNRIPDRKETISNLETALPNTVTTSNNTKKVVKEITTINKEDTAGDNIKAVESAITGSNNPYDDVRVYATEAYKKIADDKSLSPVEKGALQLLQRGIYAGSVLGETTSNALTGLDNAGTAIGNLFRAENEAKPYMTLEEGRDRFKSIGDSVFGGANSQRDTGNVLEITASKGKTTAKTELKKLYPGATSTQLDMILDQMLKESTTPQLSRPTTISNAR